MKRLLNSKLGLIFIFVLFLLLSSAVSRAAAPASPDAVAFRVMFNTDNLSPWRWYEENIKVKGAPQVLTVDGYEAVRDGRTVYVNAANVDLDVKKLYTNIYIISYNQDAADQTMDIFGQILSHWEFNVNLSPAEKDLVRKDVKRLSDLGDIKLALEKYKAGHAGAYPNLAAGSYLAGKTISKWPSWQATLGASLGVTLPVDPVNDLGACKDYDEATCWDQKNKKFADPTPSDAEFNLPVGSRAYVYALKPDGNYNLCALMESIYATTLPENCYKTTATAAAPAINCSTAAVRAGEDFIGFISLSGPDAAKFKTWELKAYSPASWPTWSNWRWTGADGLKLANTAIANTKKVSGGKPVKGDYKYEVDVFDGLTHVNKICDLKVACVPYCPAPGEICAGKTVNNGCGGQCAAGTKSDTVWTPQADPADICQEEIITEKGDCGGTRATLNGSKCCANAACNAANQPNCQTGAPVNSTRTGSCCDGQSCYQCSPGYTWENGSCINTKTVNCDGTKKPNHAVWTDGVSTFIQKWSDSAGWQPALPDASFNQNIKGSCHFGCQSNFTWDSATGKCLGCGDGARNRGEECDEGANNGVVCSANDYGSSCNYCDASCRLKTTLGPRCGDGVKNGYEVCDYNDPASSVECPNLISGLPSHCSAVHERRFCNQECTGLGNCSDQASTPILSTDNACNNEYKIIAGQYSCCELTYCRNDYDVSCCGGENATAASGALPADYTLIPEQSRTDEHTSDSTAIPYSNVDCTLGRKGANNWALGFDHSHANYRCWK